MPAVNHYEKIDLDRIEAKFSEDGKHRYSLFLPFKGRENGRTICVIGQNPSYANVDRGDKTLHYMEHLIYDKCPEISSIVVLNLFSRVDTKKIETSNLLRLQAARECRYWIKQCSDFILIYGKLTDKKAYKFKKRAQQLYGLLGTKNLLQIDIGTSYPPHPGNPIIYYGNYHVCFRDARPTIGRDHRQPETESKNVQAAYQER